MTKTFDPAHIETAEFYKIITDTVIPRPIAFVSSCDKQGNVNLSPFSFFNVFSANPPILVFSPLSRMRDNSIKHTLLNVQEHPEVVINLVNYNMVQQASLASCEFDKEINEFNKAGLTEAASEKVKPPRVKEAVVSFECKVTKTLPLGDKGGAGTLVICEIVLAYISDTVLGKDGRPDALKLDVVARLGGDWYSRFNKDSLFEVPKPWAKIGMGVDQIPVSIRNSDVLSGNDLGKLGMIGSLPTKEEVTTYTSNHKELKNKTEKEIHQLAKAKLADNQLMDAWLILLSRG